MYSTCLTRTRYESAITFDGVQIVTQSDLDSPRGIIARVAPQGPKTVLSGVEHWLIKIHHVALAGSKRHCYNITIEPAGNAHAHEGFSTMVSNAVSDKLIMHNRTG